MIDAEFATKKKDVLAQLREAAEIARDAKATTLADRIARDRIPHLEEERFHLVVLGEFNHGKTTFVNALLGASVLPVGVTPTTAVIHHLVHGEKGATAVAKDGTRRDVPLAELPKYVVEGAAARDELQYLEVRWPAPLLAEGVVLVDTPGVNDLNLQRAEITYGYVPRADAILFLLDAGQILKESERAFLSGKLLTQSRDKVLFVVNKTDLLTKEELEETLAYARANLAKLVPEPRVYPFSATKALGGDRLASGLDPFVADLGKYLADERGRILLDNALDEGLRTLGTLASSLEVQRRALTLETDDLARRLAALEQDLAGSAGAAAAREQRLRERLAAVKALVRREITEFGERFAGALPAEIEASKADELKKHLPGFIEERFRRFAEDQGDAVARRLEELAEEAIAFLEEDARARADKLRDVLGPEAPPLDLKVSTFAWDVGVVALGAVGIGLMALSNLLVGGAMTLAAPVLAWVFRERADREVKKRALEAAPKAVREAAAKMADGFDAQIDKYGATLISFVRGATEEQAKSLAEVLRAARDAKAGGDEQQGALDRKSALGSARVAALVARMTASREGLWK